MLSMGTTNNKGVGDEEEFKTRGATTIIRCRKVDLQTLWIGKKKTKK